MGKWIIPFATRSGQMMQVEVSGLSGNNNITLNGGPSPFVINEDNEEFAFHPVRLQSGRLKIVIDGDFDLRAMLPISATDRPVVLRRTSGTYTEVLWLGYIQPDAYDMEMMSPMQEVSLPVFCRLSALEGQYISGQHGHIGNFAELLQDILTNTGYTDYYFTGIDIVEWLSKKVNYSLFYEFDDDNKVYRPKKDKLEILQEICTFFGWSLRSQSERLYFLSDDAAYANTGLSYIDSTELGDIALGNTVVPTIISYDSLNISTVQFADDDYDLNLLSGKKKVTVESDINPIESLMNINSDMLERCGKDYPIYYQYFRAPTSLDQKKDLHVFTTQRTVSPQITYDMGEVLLTANNGQGSSAPYYVAPYGFDAYKGNLSKKHNINMDWQLEWIPDGKNIHGYSNPYFSIISKNHLSVSNGILSISANVAMKYIGLNDDEDEYVAEDYVPTGNILVSVKVGDKYWNGLNSWVDSPVNFNIPIGTENSEPDEDGNIKGTGEILSNRTITINNNYVVKDKPEYNGYGIPVNTAIAGVVTISFHKLDITPTLKFVGKNYVNISDIEIEFQNNVNQEVFNNTDRNQYVVENSDAFTDEEDIETIFASNKNNKYGIGLIMNADGTYCSTLSYNDGQGTTVEHPEQVLADRVAAFYSKAKRQIQMSIFRSQPLLPSTQLIEHDGTNYMQLSQEIDYQEEIVTLNIIEK